MKIEWSKINIPLLSWSWSIWFPDASKDRCVKCSVIREEHNEDHFFVEKERK